MQVPLLTIIETHEIYNLKIQLFRKEKEIVFLYPLKKNGLRSTAHVRWPMVRPTQNGSLFIIKSNQNANS